MTAAFAVVAFCESPNPDFFDFSGVSDMEGHWRALSMPSRARLLNQRGEMVRLDIVCFETAVEGRPLGLGKALVTLIARCDNDPFGG